MVPGTKSSRSWHPVHPVHKPESFIVFGAKTRTALWACGQDYYHSKRSGNCTAIDDIMFTQRRGDEIVASEQIVDAPCQPDEMESLLRFPDLIARVTSRRRRSWPFEGIYIDRNYKDLPTVTLEAGRYTGALPANPGGNIKGSGRYSAKEVGSNKWALELKFDTGGATTVMVRTIPGGIAIQDLSYGGETRLFRK